MLKNKFEIGDLIIWKNGCSRDLGIVIGFSGSCNYIDKAVIIWYQWLNKKQKVINCCSYDNLKKIE